MENLTQNATVNAIIEEIKSMNCEELVTLNNEYCESTNSMDSYIYSNEDDFLETYFIKPSDLARAICYGDYRYMDNWVTFNGYGNLESFAYMSTDKLCELVEVMAEYIAENSGDFVHFENI
jgi:hypothetical protein